MRTQTPERRDYIDEPEAPSETGISDFAILVHQHAVEMESQFACAATDGVCEHCRRPGSSLALQLNWEAVYHDGQSRVSWFRDLVGGLYIGRISCRTAEFSTYHSFCSRCASRIRLLKGTGDALRRACLILFVLGLLALIMAAAGSPFLLGHHPASRGILLSAMAISGLVSCLVGGSGALLVRSWCLPNALGGIGKRPFFLSSIERL